MGTKLNPGVYDAYVKALPDEPMFVLLARDPMASAVVRYWTRLREHGTDPAKIDEARSCADAMQRWIRFEPIVGDIDAFQVFVGDNNIGSQLTIEACKAAVKEYLDARSRGAVDGPAV